jgi:hypothetical protein
MPLVSLDSPLRVNDGRGRQADGTAGLPPAPEIPLRSGTCASCQQATPQALPDIKRGRQLRRPLETFAREREDSLHAVRQRVAAP